MARGKHSKIQRFDTEYWSFMGVFVIYAETFVTLTRMDNGFTRSFTWEDLGFVKEAA